VKNIYIYIYMLMILNIYVSVRFDENLGRISTRRD